MNFLLALFFALCSVVFADVSSVKPGCEHITLLTVLTVVPLAITAMSLPTKILIINEPYVDDHSTLLLLPVQEDDTGSVAPPLVILTSSTTLHVRSNVANVANDTTVSPDVVDGEPNPPVGENGNTSSLSHSVIASIGIALFIFSTSLVALYLWRHYYPPPQKPRRHRGPLVRRPMSSTESLSSLVIAPPPAYSPSK
ncbi:hypothetical protein H0H93_016911 [Arthromyces matolae]|nr:hypothetical protein H0H93_016911 [Arthromyces matolae]